tara:strand:+ start:15094 stop:15993 length:900 start_codon:yes stop_codon:yes gene_type:complete
MFTLIIPAYNEESSLKNSSFLEKITAELFRSSFEGFELLIVDDGSNDSTLKILKDFQKNYDFIKVFSNAKNKGYGSTLKFGISKAKFDTIIITDIDGTYPSSDVLKILNIYIDSQNRFDNPIDMVVGQRTGKNYWESLFKFSLRSILKFIVQWSTGTKVPDINSGLRVFSKKTISGYLPKLSNYFSFTSTSTIAYLLTNRTLQYEKIEYHERKGEENKTKVNLLRDSLRTLQYVFETTTFYNPFKVFLLISIIFFIISFLFGLSLFINKDSGIIFISLIFLLSSILSLITGFFSVLKKK